MAQLEIHHRGDAPSASRRYAESSWTKPRPERRHLSLELLVLVTSILFTLGMKSKEMDQKFQEGISLIKSEDGLQDGANIWMELAELGHLDSIEQLVYIFLEQTDFELAEYYINCARDSNEPIILYLKARLIEERYGRDDAIPGFKAAASAGNPNSNLLMFELALEDCSFESANYFLEKLRGHEEILSLMSNPTNLENLRHQLDIQRKHFQDLSEFNAETKAFTIAVGSDETDVYLEVRVYDYYSKKLVRKFHDDLIGAVEFCSSRDLGFEVIYVGDSWDIADTEIVYRGKVLWSEKKITISANYEDYWVGELNEIDSAIEELIDKESDWELVNYHSIKRDNDVDIVEEKDVKNKNDESSANYVELALEDATLAQSMPDNSTKRFPLNPSNIPVDLNSLDEEDCDWWAQFAEERTQNDGTMYVPNRDEDLVFLNLISRAREIKCDQLADLIGEGIIPAPFAAELILCFVPLHSDVLTQLELLQIGMNTVHQWPDVHFDGFHIDFLNLMWSTLDLVDKKVKDSAQADEILEHFLDSDSFWTEPIVLTSIVALKKPSSEKLTMIFNKFLSCWDFETRSLKEDNDLDLMDNDLGNIAPLLAVCALSPNTSVRDVHKILEMTTWIEDSDFGVYFWEYVCTLVSRGEGSDYWCPITYWRDGFFDNGIEHHQTFIDTELEFECLKYYLDNRSRLNFFDNYPKEQETEKHIIALLSRHPVADKEVIREARLIIRSLRKKTT